MKNEPPNIKMMRTLYLIALLFVIPLIGLTQGIDFEHGNWKEVLAKAKVNNKPVFIDVYTTWCGPCKIMSKDIFPLEKVGGTYNSGFVCYQIDAEKGEGIEIAKKYKVTGFPTYLFIKSDGTLFYRALGSMEANLFLVVAKTALTEMNDPKPMEEWEKEYTTRKNDPAFMVDYMGKRSKLGLSNTELFDEYMKLLPEGERTTDAVMDIYIKARPNLIVTSLAYENLQKNITVFSMKYKGALNSFLVNGVFNTAREAAKTKNEGLLSSAVSAYDKLPKNRNTRYKEEIYLEYYQRTGETEKYLKYTTDLCNEQLMRISDDSINKRNKDYSMFIEKWVGSSPKLDSSRIQQLRSSSVNMESNRIAMSLNNYAWEVFKKGSHINLLSDAMNWSKRSLELSPNNVVFLDTYANLLYKLGRKEEAISKEEEALNKAVNHKDSVINKTLKRMKAGEKTWE